MKYMIILKSISTNYKFKRKRGSRICLTFKLLKHKEKHREAKTITKSHTDNTSFCWDNTNKRVRL